MSPPIVSVNQLRKVYSVRSGLGKRVDMVAVDGVSFDLAPGGSLGIVGESGSGKTTIARILVGLERATSGQITIAGHRHTEGRVGDRERRRRGQAIQIVFQDPFTSLDPRQSVAGALDEALRIKGGSTPVSRRARMAQLLSQVGLDQAFERAHPRALSGGQRQRVAIARALAVEPSVLVLDEPTSALDVSIQAQVLELLIAIRRETGIAYLFISHDLAVVRHVTDRVLVMREGKVVEEGSTADVLHAPKQPYTQLLLDSIPRSGWTPKRQPEEVSGATQRALSSSRP